MPAFTITYWGITGGMTASLTPEQVTEKIVRAVAALAEAGGLDELKSGPTLLEKVRRAVHHLPFAIRSSFGGNTTCVEVQTADSLILFDGGSGLGQLSIDLERRWNAPGYAGSRAAHLVFTHAHLDHVFAARFLEPLYDPRNHFSLWAPRAVLDNFTAAFDPSTSLHRVFLPISRSMMRGLREVQEVESGKPFAIGATQVQTFALRHPGGCLAYRLDNGGRSFVFATDHEQIDAPDESLAEFARNADVLYLDGQYLRGEYEGRDPIPSEIHPQLRRGWGHSTIESCVATALAAGVHELHVGHREPKRTDAELAAVEKYLIALAAEAVRRSDRPNHSMRALIPYEGLRVEV